jgi:hypothetical protein
VETCRAGTHGDRIGRLVSTGKGLFESVDPITHRNPTAIDDFGERCLFIIAESRFRY